MATKNLTPSRHFGKICLKHPEFDGLRQKPSSVCVECMAEYNTQKRVDRKKDPEYKNKLKNQMKEFRKNRKLSKEKRIPPWANIKKIKEIYDNCPDGMEVDHIIPLHGEIVSGLHVHNNLQYLTPAENEAKGNKYVPEN